MDKQSPQVGIASILSVSHISLDETVYSVADFISSAKE
jgi:hypothetical protein